MKPVIPNSSTPDQVFHLATPGELKPAVMLGLGLPSRVSGLPAFYYWKDAIVVGSYVHPAGRFSLDVTRQRLDGYAENFQKMKNNGVGVPILMDHTQSAAATLGWIVDVKRRGDRLIELHQFLGESARDIGLRNKVSLGIDPNFVDGKGVRYGEAIVHSAVTPVPMVPDQGTFESAEEAAMSQEGDGVIVLSLACESKPAADIPPQPPVAQPAAPAISPSQPAVELQMAMGALADAAAAKRDLAVARGGVDPAVADELFALLVRASDGALNTLMLSRHGGQGPVALMVFDILARNQPTAMGEATAIQILSRPVPGEDADRLLLQERMIALANGNSP